MENNAIWAWWQAYTKAMEHAVLLDTHIALGSQYSTLDATK